MWGIPRGGVRGRLCPGTLSCPWERPVRGLSCLGDRLPPAPAPIGGPALLTTASWTASPPESVLRRIHRAARQLRPSQGSPLTQRNNVSGENTLGHPCWSPPARGRAGQGVSAPSPREGTPQPVGAAHSPCQQGRAEARSPLWVAARPGPPWCGSVPADRMRGQRQGQTAGSGQ